MKSARDTAVNDPSLADSGDVARSLGADPMSGLTAAEASDRLARAGPNRIDPSAEIPTWRKFVGQFADPLVYLLLAAVVISLAAWMIEGSEGTPYEVIVIAIVVLANAVLGFVQERKAERAVAALQRMAATSASVLRDGTQVRIPAADIVPGDTLILREGDAISADARLVETASLTVAEASLTGESEPVVKDPSTLDAPASLGDRLNMVFSGTAVTRGAGRAVVTSTGMGTEIGRIASLLERTEWRS
jgi:P-type Ca2+ transporter type 2C